MLQFAHGTPRPGAPTEAQAANPMSSLPPVFIKNRGQVDHRASYYLQGRDAGIFFTREGLALSLLDSTHKQRFGLRLDFLGARDVTPVARSRTRAVTSYFKGRRADWKTNVPTYSAVAYGDLWPGIDLVYTRERNQLKYNFLVKPGADPRNIQLGWRGASGLAVNGRGQLEVSTPARTLVDEAPTTYQRTGGRRVAVKSSYSVDAKRKTYGFSIGGYDRSRPLVIDPAVLVYAGFIGGTGGETGGHVALDSARNLYLIGSTTSTDFPTTVGGPDPDFNGGCTDAYIAKVNPSGTGLVYAGFIGGSQRDDPFKVAVDAAGAAYVTGSTASTEAQGFPVMTGPDVTFNGGPQDAFIAKVKPDGTGLEYAGYIGGSATTPMGAMGNEQGNAVAVDGSGRAYVSGFTRSRETQGFPNGTGFGALNGYDQTFNGALEAFLARVKTDGSGVDYATYVGGGGADAGRGVAVDASGNAYQNIGTGSNQNALNAMTNPFGGFPVTAGAFDTTFNGGPNVPAPSDTAEVKLNTNVTGSASLVYSTYIGGAGTDDAFSNVVDSAGNVYITGSTDSDASTFPNGTGFGSIPGFDHILNTGASTVTPTPTDSWVAKLNASGSNLEYATYVGGSGSEQSIGIDINGAGSAYISGTTNSGDGSFPASNGPDSTFNGDPATTHDSFVAKLDPFGTGLGYAGFIGGTGDERDTVGMKVDSDGNAYVSGITASTDFPATVGPDLTYNQGEDAYVAKIAEMSPTGPGNGSSGGSTQPPSTPPDTSAPGVSGYGLTNNPFVVSGARTPTFGVAAVRRHKRGTTFRYTLSETATVRIRIAQRRAGRRRGRRCVAPTRALRRARGCTRIITRGTLTRVSHVGRNSVAFSGRIGSRKLSAGSYQATLTATDAAGNTSRGRTIRFTIVNR